MSTYRALIASAAVVVSLPLLASPSLAIQRGSAPPTAASATDRGRYVVEDVAMCWTCHTPRDEQGAPDRLRALMGGPVPFQPARPTYGWADVAPRLAGLPPGTDDDFIKLMMTGISRLGTRPRPPMPQFRMTRADAEAVLAYLKSLAPE